MVGPVPIAAPLLAAGKLRIVGIPTSRRQGGIVSEVPTWREQGIDVAIEGWRGVIGPKGLDRASVQYWENALAAMVETDDWKKTSSRTCAAEIPEKQRDEHVSRRPDGAIPANACWAGTGEALSGTTGRSLSA